MNEELILIELINGRVFLGKLLSRDDDEKLWEIEDPRLLVTATDPKTGNQSVRLAPHYNLPRIYISMQHVTIHTTSIDPDVTRAYVQSTSKLDLTSKLRPVP